MKRLESVKLVQFLLYEQQEFRLEEITGLFGRNGSGKSSALDAVQTTSLALLQHVVPHAACAVGAVTAHEALVNLCAQHLIAEAASAPGPCEPRVEATPRDTERLAHQIDRPGPSVFRHEAELHIDSFAK